MPGGAVPRTGLWLKTQDLITRACWAVPDLAALHSCTW